ncbi:unnamed protein product [Tilletia controversa]|nr:unnamed protein product [Tilletia controversa]
MTGCGHPSFLSNSHSVQSARPRAAIAEDIGRQLVTAGDRFKSDHIEIEKVDFKAALATSQHLWDANIAIDVAWSVLPPPLLLSFTQADVDSLTLSAPTGHNNITL